MTSTSNPSDGHAAPETDERAAFWRGVVERMANTPPDLMRLLYAEADQFDRFHSHVTLSIQTAHIDAIDAAIRSQVRKEIAKEVEERIESWIHSATWFPASFRETSAIDGLREALRIIERGAATEGQG